MAPDTAGLASMGILLRAGDWDRLNPRLCSGHPTPPAPCAPHSRRLRALPLGALHAHATAPRAEGPGAPARPATVHGLRSEAHGNALPIQTPLPRQTNAEQAHSKLLTLVRTRWVEGLEEPRGEDPKGWGRPPSSHPRHRPHGGVEQRIKESSYTGSPGWRHLGELLNQALSQSLHSADGNLGQRGLAIGEDSQVSL